MVSIGHRTGLFDIMRLVAPARPEEIATRAGLNERYVREWIGAMVTGGVVDFDPASNCYSLSAEHAAFLTRADSGQSVLSSLESHILPLVPGLTERLAKGIRVLDAGCGRGRILTRLAELYPRSPFVGMDLSPEATGYARDQAAKASLKNVEFIAVDLSTFDTTGRSASWSSKIAGQCPAFKFFDAIQRVIFLRENTASDQKPFLLKAP
jgi:2-polyprenyl-3-methyl-5-hydroxy-6-metoxy-1,4-benzoquinol methylase